MGRVIDYVRARVVVTGLSDSCAAHDTGDVTGVQHLVCGDNGARLGQEMPNKRLNLSKNGEFGLSMHRISVII